MGAYEDTLRRLQQKYSGQKPVVGTQAPAEGQTTTYEATLSALQKKYGGGIAAPSTPSQDLLPLAADSATPMDVLDASNLGTGPDTFFQMQRSPEPAGLDMPSVSAPPTAPPASATEFNPDPFATPAFSSLVPPSATKAPQDRLAGYLANPTHFAAAILEGRVLPQEVADLPPETLPFGELQQISGNPATIYGVFKPLADLGLQNPQAGRAALMDFLQNRETTGYDVTRSIKTAAADIVTLGAQQPEVAPQTPAGRAADVATRIAGTVATLPIAAATGGVLGAGAAAGALGATGAALRAARGVGTGLALAGSRTAGKALTGEFGAEDAVEMGKEAAFFGLLDAIMPGVGGAVGKSVMERLPAAARNTVLGRALAGGAGAFVAGGAASGGVAAASAVLGEDADASEVIQRVLTDAASVGLFGAAGAAIRFRPGAAEAGFTTPPKAEVVGEQINGRIFRGLFGGEIAQARTARGDLTRLGYQEWRPGSGVWQKRGPNGQLIGEIHEDVIVAGRQVPKVVADRSARAMQQSAEPMRPESAGTESVPSEPVRTTNQAIEGRTPPPQATVVPPQVEDTNVSVRPQPPPQATEPAVVSVAQQQVPVPQPPTTQPLPPVTFQSGEIVQTQRGTGIVRSVQGDRVRVRVDNKTYVFSANQVTKQEQQQYQPPSPAEIITNPSAIDAMTDAFVGEGDRSSQAWRQARPIVESKVRDLVRQGNLTAEIEVFGRPLSDWMQFRAQTPEQQAAPRTAQTSRLDRAAVLRGLNVGEAQIPGLVQNMANVSDDEFLEMLDLDRARAEQLARTPLPQEAPPIQELPPQATEPAVIPAAQESVPVQQPAPPPSGPPAATSPVVTTPPPVPTTQPTPPTATTTPQNAGQGIDRDALYRELYPEGTAKDSVIAGPWAKRNDTELLDNLFKNANPDQRSVILKYRQQMKAAPTPETATLPPVLAPPPVTPESPEEANEKAKSLIESAKTGEPITAKLFRGESKGRRDYQRGVFYSYKEYANLYRRMGDILGDGGKVVAENVRLENPRVFWSKAVFLQELARGGDTTAAKFLKPNGALRDDIGAALIERYIADKLRAMGHDGYVSRFELELVDLAGKGRDKSSRSPTQPTPSPEKAKGVSVGAAEQAPKVRLGREYGVANGNRFREAYVTQPDGTEKRIDVKVRDGRKGSLETRAAQVKQMALEMYRPTEPVAQPQTEEPVATSPAAPTTVDPRKRLRQKVEEPGELGFPANASRMSTAATAGRVATPTKTDIAARTVTEPTKQNIVNFISRTFQVPVRQGRFRQSAEGIYKWKPEVIRTRGRNLTTNAHELGHHLDKILGLSKDTRFDEDLMPLGQALYPNETNPTTLRREGVAEFMRLFIMKPQSAFDAAPQYAAELRKVLDGNPELKQGIENLRDLYNAYTNLDPQQHLRAGIAPNKPPILKRMREALNPTRLASAGYAGFVDEYSPILAAENAILAGAKMPLSGRLYDVPLSVLRAGARLRKETAPTESAYSTLWRARGIEGRADRWILGDGRDAEPGGPVVGKTLQQILVPVKNRMEDFRDYVVALKASRAHELELETGYDPDKVQAVLAKLDSPVFKKVADELSEFRRATTQELVKAEILDAETVKGWEERWPYPFPFYRDMGEGQSFQGGGKKAVNIGKPVKIMKGSDRPIIDPIQSIIRDTYHYFKLAEMNKAALNMVKTADGAEGMGWLVEKVPTPMEGQKFKLEDIQRFLDPNIVDSKAFNPESVAAIFRPQRVAGVKEAQESIATVWMDGKPVFYQFNPDVYDALFKGGPKFGKSVGWMVDILRPFARVLRSSVTLGIEFAGRNVMRDSQETWIYSKAGVTPWDTMTSGLELLTREIRGKGMPADYWQAKSAGAFFKAAIVSMDRDYQAMSIDQLLGDKPGRVQRITSFFTQPTKMPARTFHALEAFSEFFENINRYAEVRKMGQKLGWDEKSAMEIALAGRDVTIDFRRSGNRADFIKAITAFWNAQVQGLDKFVRAHKENPGRTIVRALLYVTIPTLLHYLWVKDDPEYQEQPRWMKDTFFLIPIGKKSDGRTQFLPLPRVFAPLGLVYGVLPLRMMEFLEANDKRAADELTSRLWELVPMPLPTVIGVLGGALLNTGWWGGPIVPREEERYEPPEQYGAGTSEFAKQIGKVANVSPRKVDYVITGLSGYLGKYTSYGLDKLAVAAGVRPEPPASEAEDLPVLRAFLKSGVGTSSESLNRFYEEKDALDREYNTMSKKADEGFYDKLPQAEKDAIVARAVEMQAKRKAMNAVARALSDLRRLRTDLDEGTKREVQDYTPAQRRKIIDAVDTLRANIARGYYNRVDGLPTDKDLQRQLLEYIK